MANGNKPLRKLKTFIKSESGGVSQDNVIKIGGLTLGLLGGMFGNDLFAGRSHTNTVDLTYDAGTPKLGTHVNTASWTWTWGWANWGSCSCA